MFHDVDQNSDAWYQLRAGRLTGSVFAKIMANYGKAFGEPAKKYAANIALEQILGGPIETDSYQNAHMERGHEQEPLARMKYEEEFFAEVTNGGFFEEDWIGVSPDGLVGKKGMVEIKSVIPSVHYNNIRRQSYDPAYKWQLMAQLKYTGRDWVDFISFCADFPDNKKIFVYRLHAVDCFEEFIKMNTRVAEFRDLVDQVKKTMLTSSYFVKGGNHE